MFLFSSIRKSNHNCLMIFQYVAAALLLAAPHLLCDNRRPQTLRWLLAPTAALAAHIGRFSFLWEPYAGYVSHELRFIIAPSCSGLTFFTIAAAMLIFSFLPRPAHKKGSLWIPASLLLAYGFTILANSLRILLAIYIPFLLRRYDLQPAGLTQDTLHTMIGVSVYFPSLLLLYPVGERFSSLLTGEGFASLLPGRTRLSVRKGLLPTLWYLTVVLVIPFVLRLVHHDLGGFAAYASAVLTACIPILLATGILLRLSTSGGHGT